MHSRAAGVGANNASATRTSPSWPGVIAKAINLPRQSTTAWIFVVRPPRERPIACAKAPLSAAGRAVGLGRRAVDHLGVAAIRSHQGLEQSLPEPAPGPPVEAIVDRRGRSVEGRAILPTATHLEHMNDAADHPSIVDPTRARLIVRQQRFDRRPLLLVEPELVRHHQRSIV